MIRACFLMGNIINPLETFSSSNLEQKTVFIFRVVLADFEKLKFVLITGYNLANDSTTL